MAFSSVVYLSKEMHPECHDEFRASDRAARSCSRSGTCGSAVTAGVTSTVTIEVPGAVFFEPSPEDDITVTLERSGLRTTWRPGWEQETPFERLAVIDESKVELERLFADADQRGT